MLEISIVRQKHRQGCLVATLAMILGLSYDDALILFPYHPDDHKGFSSFVGDTILVEQGYAVARKYKCRTGFGKGGNEKRSVWPPEPWGPIHWCEVMTSAGGHAVVMLEDGTVLDPWEGRQTTLMDPAYLQVNFVAAIVPLVKDAL